MKKPVTIFDEFDLTDEEFIDIQIKYALLEPLLSDYLTEKQKKELRVEVCQKLGIKKRTLRKYLQNLREQGAVSLARKKRRDKGVARKVQPELIAKVKMLLKQNPYRSIPMVLDLLRADPETEFLVADITVASVYAHLRKEGFSIHKERNTRSNQPFRRFEAEYINQLWQGDARHGILLPHPHKPGKQKMTYLFAWIDDFSRKILFARYYWDEKEPRLDDCLRQAILRWGIPEKIYVDNGSAYISAQFTCIVSRIGIRKIHHPPYQAWCKGKVEALMKRIKVFQREAGLAGFKTIDELNQTLAAWIDIEYDNKIHSTTGQTPNIRFRENMQIYPPRRIKDIEVFNSYFLWQDFRTVNKYGFISFKKNTYRIRDIGCGENVEIRFDPFDLTYVHIYLKKKFYSTVKAYKITRKEYPGIPQEQKKPEKEISREAQIYFQKIREKHLQERTEDMGSFSNIIKEDDND